MNAIKVSPQVTIRNSESIRNDLTTIQLSPSKELFEKSLELFLEKYKEHKHMCEELRKGWFRQGMNTWYEGFCKGVPSTSNAVESFYLNSLKAKGKLYNRLPLFSSLIT
jgi:hypothetical protein